MKNIPDISPRYATDAEVAYVSRYVGGFMDDAEEREFERKLGEDEGFFYRVGPLLKAWYSHTPAYEGTAVDIRLATVKKGVRRIAKPALLFAAAAAVLVVVKLQPWAEAPVESAPPRGQAVAATEKALRDSVAALTGALVKLTASAPTTTKPSTAPVTVRRVANALPQANRDGDRTTEALVAPLPMTLLTPARLPAQPGATVVLTAIDPNWIPKPIPIQRRPFDVGQVPALGTRLPAFAPKGPVRTPPPEQPVFKPLFPKRPPTLNDGGPIDDCTVPCALRRGRDGTRRK